MILVRVKWPNILFRLRNSNKAFLRSNKIWKSKNPTESLALCILIVVFEHFVGCLAGLLVEFPPQKYVEIRRIFLSPHNSHSL